MENFYGYDGLEGTDDDPQGYGNGGGWGGAMMGSIGSLGAFVYAPNLGPVGSGSAGTYYPGDVTQDARALNFLGILPDFALQKLIGTTGSQKSDAAAGAGAWNPEFREAVKIFQDNARLTADGWIGPATRTALLAAVSAKNASGGSLPTPPMPIPGGGGGGGGLSPVVAKTEDNTGLYLVGAGVIGALALGWYLLK